MQKQRPPRIISGPPEGHVLLVFSSQHQSATHLVRLRAHSYQSILAVPFGHCQYNAPLSRLELNFFIKRKSSILKVEGVIVVGIWYFQCGLFVGSSPTKNAHKFFEDFGSISYVQKVENYDFQYWLKKLCRSMYFGLRSTVN